MQTGRSLLCVLTLLIFYNVTHAVTPVIIRKTGPVENRIDVVFLAEGYTASQKTAFLSRVRAVVKQWQQLSPWNEAFRALNIYAVPLVSQQSGADHPPGILKNTILDASYNCAGIQRLVCIDSAKATIEAQAAVPAFDYIVVIVNDQEYGGSGGNISVFSVNSSASEIFFHEFGHSFAKLADEYTAAGSFVPNPNIEPLAKNVTRQTSRAAIKWKKWILPTTPIPTPVTATDVIGLFQGAYYHSTAFYRPKENCLMRSLGVPLCEVCREAHMLVVHDQISLLDSHLPAAASITISRSASQIFSIKTVPFPTSRLKIEWLIDGRIQTGQLAKRFTLAPNSLPAGKHKIMVRVTDITALIRKDPRNLRKTSFTWTVVVR